MFTTIPVPHINSESILKIERVHPFNILCVPNYALRVTYIFAPTLIQVICLRICKHYCLHLAPISGLLPNQIFQLPGRTEKSKQLIYFRHLKESVAHNNKNLFWEVVLE